MMTKKYQYAVRSKTATPTNDKRCWMNIGTAKLERAAKSGDKYWFVCMIDEHTYVYSAPAAELQEAFEECDVDLMGMSQGYPKYSFYLDYETGEIFRVVSCNIHDAVYQLEPEDVNPAEVGGEDVGPEPGCTDKTPHKYAVLSKTATSMNDERCWMNIGTAKLERAAKSGDKYWFVCMIDGHTYVYSAPAAELQEAFEKYDVTIMGIEQDRPRYSFYLDYKTGKILTAASRDMNDVVYQLETEDVVPR